MAKRDRSDDALPGRAGCLNAVLGDKVCLFEMRLEETVPHYMVVSIASSKLRLDETYQSAM